MGALEVHSLPLGDLEPFLDRKRYSAFAMSQLQLPSFLGEILRKANDFVENAPEPMVVLAVRYRLH